MTTKKASNIRHGNRRYLRILCWRRIASLWDHREETNAEIVALDKRPAIDENFIFQGSGSLPDRGVTASYIDLAASSNRALLALAPQRAGRYLQLVVRSAWRADAHQIAQRAHAQYHLSHLGPLFFAFVAVVAAPTPVPAEENQNRRNQ